MAARKNGGFPRQKPRELALIAVKLTEAHTPIDSHAPIAAAKFFPEFKKYLVEYRIPHTMAEGSFRVHALYKSKTEAEEAMHSEYFKDGRVVRLKELKSHGWEILKEYKTVAKYFHIQREEGGNAS